MTTLPTDPEIKRAILNNLTVPLWPHVGKALGISRNPVYEAGRRGDFPTIRVGGRVVMSTATLRKMLGLDAGGEPPASAPALGATAETE